MAMVINEEQQMLKESAAGFLAEFAPVTELRKQRDAGSEKGYADNLWRQMADMGWAAILVPEAYGGLEFGHYKMQNFDFRMQSAKYFACLNRKL